MFFKTKRDNLDKSLYKGLLINGLCYSAGNRVFMLKGGKAYEFYSPRAFASWKLPATEIDPEVCVEFFSGRLGFRDSTLIQNAKDGRIYLISGTKKRLVTAPLSDYCFDISQIVEVSDAETQFHSDGEDI